AGHLLGTDFAGRHALHGQVDSFVGVGTDLEGGGAKRAVKQLLATEAGGFGDTVQLGGQLAELGLHGLALIGAVRAVGGLQSQFAHTLQNAGGLAHGGFGGLSHGDAVVGVLHGNVQAVDLAGQAVGDLQAGSVVLGAIDAQAAGQALHGGGQVV